MPIEVDGGSMHELLLVAWLAFESGQEHEGFELGGDWFDRVADATPTGLRAEIEELGGGREDIWFALRGLVAHAPAPHDIDSVLDWLGRMDPTDIRRALLAYQCIVDDEPDQVDRAVGGDLEALRRLLPESEGVDYYQRLFSLDEGTLRDRLVTALRDFRSVYDEFSEGFATATTRAADDLRPMVRGSDPEGVIEGVTNGLDYRIPLGMSRLVLIPSVVTRPWAVIDRYRDVLIVVFSVADEYLHADPDAPTSWVVKVHKALGDEKRLRILRRLAEAPTGLDDLATLLGVTKSTVHHHVGLLRSAGLVRVSIDPSSGTKAYTIRPSVLPGAREALDEYLNPNSMKTESARNER